MKTKFDVISIGDTTLDVFLELEKEIKVIKEKNGKEYLGILNAEKIPGELSERCGRKFSPWFKNRVVYGSRK